jgi:hypothetical protein
VRHANHAVVWPQKLSAAAQRILQRVKTPDWRVMLGCHGQASI